MAAIPDPLPRAQRTAEQLQQMIAGGEWPAGGRIPTTRELANRFGVSLNTIQGALRELEVLGLVQRRPRVGTFVRTRPGESLDPRRARRARTGTGHICVLWNRAAAARAPHPEDTWGQRILHSAQQVFAAAGYHLILVYDRIEQWERRLDDAGDIAGVLSFVDETVRPVLRRLDRRRLPWVTINPLDEHEANNFVSADNYAGGRLVGRCFARMQYERVLLLGTPLGRGPGDTPPKRSMTGKVHGFIQGYFDEDMPLRGIEYACHADASEPIGYQQTCRYLDRFGTPQGIFTSGDFLALGAMRALRERGIDVPGDVGVVGGTGLEVGAYAHPPLTVLAQPMEDMGQAAAGMLLNMIESGSLRTRGERRPCKLLLRGSLALTGDALTLVEPERMARAAVAADGDSAA